MSNFQTSTSRRADNELRSHWAIQLLLSAVILVLMADPAVAARRALVIGIDNYQAVAPLRNARADAQTMAAALRNAGYDVDLQTDRTLRQLLGDVRAFRQKIAGGDEVVVFFSGHGVQLGGTNYLLPTDITAESEDQVRDEALALSKVLEDLRESKPRFVLAIIDACRDNPFSSAGKAIGGRGLAGVAGATGQMVIYAAGEGQRALDQLGRDDPVRNGLFTRVFVREMAQPGVSIRDVLFRVRDEVATLAESVRHEQVPAVYDQVRGNFFFIPPRTEVSGSAQPTASTIVPATPAQSSAVLRPDASQSSNGTPSSVAVAPALLEKVTFSADTFFLSGSPSVPAEAEGRLLDFAKIAEGLVLEVIIAVGHADATESDPQQLSYRRAEAAKAQLVSRGIEAARIYTEGKGASQPVADSRTVEGRAKNRRVELELIGTQRR